MRIGEFLDERCESAACPSLIDVWRCSRSNRLTDEISDATAALFVMASLINEVGRAVARIARMDSLEMICVSRPYRMLSSFSLV